MKTNKTISKRFTITKNGKVIKRKAGQGHFNSRESGKTTIMKRRDVSLSKHSDVSLSKHSSNVIKKIIIT